MLGTWQALVLHNWIHLKFRKRVFLLAVDDCAKGLSSVTANISGSYLYFVRF